jgi:hypothetical protein
VTASRVPEEAFVREYGCTQDEWLRWMPEAVHGHPWTMPQAGRLEVSIGKGVLAVAWEVLPPRTIALIRLPRMAVRFEFQGVSPDERAAFMKRFDLHLQRGGG